MGPQMSMYLLRSQDNILAMGTETLSLPACRDLSNSTQTPNALSVLKPRCSGSKFNANSVSSMATAVYDTLDGFKGHR